MTNQSLLPVTQKDREAYPSLNMLPPEDAEAVRAGKWDGVTGMQVLARHRVAHTAPAEPVLRWEGNWLKIGDVTFARAGDMFDGSAHWRTVFDGQEYAPTLTEARAAAEQAVKDWLKRAGCV